MKNKFMIFSVHPDDETLGCGGTILKYRTIGHSVSIVYLTNGNETQRNVIPKINELYDFNSAYNLNFKELTLDDNSLNNLISPISEIVISEKPDILIVPNRSDIHSDHRRAFLAIQSCFKSFRYPSIKKILMSEVISETDLTPALPENIFIPNIFVDISDHFQKKIDIYKYYSSEIMPDNYSRSLSSLESYNRYRGSQINVNYAEVFMLIKEIL